MSAEPRGTLRLTFRSSGGQIKLVSQEHLAMLCAPSVGERPEVGRHGGYWVELRDEAGNVLFHRVLHDPLQTSVEVPAPGGPQRRFGAAPDALFEVLIPDDPAGRSVVLVGEGQPDMAVRAGPALASQELAQFDLGPGGPPAGPGGAP